MKASVLHHHAGTAGAAQALPALNGIAWTLDRLADLVAQAEAELAPYGDRAATLIEAARFVAERKR